jgi:hypothetical protein
MADVRLPRSLVQASYLFFSPGRFSAMDIDQSGQLEANEVQALLAKDHRWANIEPREDCVKMVSFDLWIDLEYNTNDLDCHSS